MRPRRWAALETVTTRAPVCFDEHREETSGEGEVAEVVRAELELEALRGASRRAGA